MLTDRLVGGDERFAVTGASGWFGLTTLDFLNRVLGPQGIEKRVLGFASGARKVRLADGTEVALRPLNDLLSVVPQPTHILHYASPTRARVAALGVEGFLRASTEITLTVLRAIDEHRPAGLFVTSSGAVYGTASRLADLERDAYGATKHLDELALRQASRDAGTASLVMRVFSVSGAYMTRPNVYALGDLITQATRGMVIRVQSQHAVRRSYVAVADLVAVALAELMDPASPDQVLDASGDEVVEIGELAVRVRNLVGSPNGEIRRNLTSLSTSDDYFGDGSALRSMATRHGLAFANLDDQIRETASAWR